MDVGEYRVFEGDEYRVLMLRLLRDGFIPISTKTGMRLMLCALQTREQEHLDRLVNKYIDTGDGLVTTQEHLIHVPFAEQLRKPDDLADLVAGQIRIGRLPNGFYLGRADLENDGVNMDFTQEQALNHRGWLARAHENSDLLKQFVEAAFAYVKDRYGHETTMSYDLPPRTQIPMMRASFISYLGWRYKPGNYGLLTNPGRIIGLKSPLPENLRRLVHV